MHVALAAAEQLAAEGIHAQVISMPCWELFAEQADAVQDEILPPEVPTLSVEAGHLVRLGPLGRRQRRASTASAPPPPATASWPSSASPPSTSPNGPGG